MTNKQAEELATYIWATACSAAQNGRAEREYAIFRLEQKLMECFPERETFPPLMGGWF